MQAQAVYPLFKEPYPLVKTLALCQHVVMVCLYCNGETEVTNSRAKARNPSVWRRRACKQCDAQFTTLELPGYDTALTVQGQDKKHLYPFSRDKLFLSLHRALGHRKTALGDATALTGTVIARLFQRKLLKDGVLESKDLSKAAYEVLKRFDPLAATSYKAYHLATLRP